MSWLPGMLLILLRFICYQSIFNCPNDLLYDICCRLGDSSIGSSQSFRQIAAVGTYSMESDFLHDHDSKTLDDLRLYDKVYLSHYEFM